MAHARTCYGTRADACASGEAYNAIIVDALNDCIERKGMKVYGLGYHDQSRPFDFYPPPPLAPEYRLIFGEEGYRVL